MSASPLPPSQTAPSTTTATKPNNVFSNDGSFLTRFKRVDPLQDATEEKKRVQQQLLRKKAADERFKNRGKRPLPTTNTTDSETNQTSSTSDGTSTLTKKPRTSTGDEQVRSEYQKEVDRLKRAGGLRDEGYAVRPVLK
ncbi:BQ2448_1075 [Microbotryum intermedium]|uniref:BQ2448_1075 protein n=1 Tax=Microbotryum intermedium TaxID=269621 RepID=A0A238FC52_9BASI|nr:BQ2448_1075 [Microbotryum intermedium]